MHLPVTLGDDAFTFNVELLVDPCSGAFVGASVRDTEDAQAVIDAVADGVATVGASPLAVLLDNKPSNHAAEVHDALGDIEIMRATPYRPQNKAHVEGAFGLFRQVAPALAIMTGSARELARQLVEIVIVLWARTTNHRPRKDRGGKTRVELHLDHEPTAEEIEAARAALKGIIRQHEQARQTLAARQDPVVRAALADAFAHYGFDDPNGEFLNAIASYPLDAVIDGIAVVAGKKRAGTWPVDADARYFLGIVCRIARERETWEIGLALWDERKRAGDRALDAAEGARARIDEDFEDINERIKDYVDRALATSRRIDRFFWLGAIADVVLDGEEPSRHALFCLAARRMAATHAVPYLDRQAATRFLAAKILPVA